MFMRLVVAYRIIDKDLERCQDWIGDRTGSVGYDVIQAIGLEKNGELVAVTGYNNFTEKSCQVHLCIDKGVYPTKEYLWFVHYYPFVQAGLNVMLAIMPQANDRIIRLAQHLGFVLKVWLDEAELMVYAMSKNSCKWIGVNNG